MTTPTITDYPGDIPAKGQSNTVFDTNVDAYLVWLSTLNIPELKILTPWIAGIRDEVAATAMSGTLPSIAGKAANFVRVNAGETAMEFRTPAEVIDDLGLYGFAELTPAATVDIDLTANDHFALSLDQNTTLTMSNVRSLDTFNLKLTGHATTPALYDMDAAEYASKSFSVAGQDTQSYGMAFKPDGLSIFIIGQVTDAVYQYTLATAWDVSTASYASKSFSVAGQETSPQGVTFKPDGLSMFIVGFNSDTVYQYTLSTAWDVSTASYASKSFSVAGQETSPREIVFKPDGTAMLIVGTTNDTVYQYTLSTAWDVSTASYASKSFSVAGQETTPLGMAFSVDGTAMLIVGTTNDTVYQYTLSTAWDVSTASYASKSFSVAGQDTQPVSLGFKTDGTVMFILGTTNNTVYQYTCDGSVYATVTYPAAFDFPNGDVPTAPLDDVVNSIDFVTTDGGTTWLGTQIGEDYK